MSAHHYGCGSQFPSKVRLVPIPDSDSSPPNPEDRPVLWYDGECGLCRHWVGRWKDRSGQRIRFRPAQDLGEGESALSPQRLAQAVHLVEPDGRISEGAAAVFRLRELGLGRPRLAAAYRSSPLFARFAEWTYRLVARHRLFFSCLTRLFHGRNGTRHDSA